ncbi:MAG: fibronectin type III domain-containing protein [Candidatus Kapaibacteriota bacterium]
MKLLRLFAASVAVLAVFVIIACDTPGTGPGTTVTVPTPADSLKATSISATTVRLKWNASTATSLTGYRVTILNTASGAVIGTTNASTATTFDVNGLTAGTVYLFRVQARNNDTVSAAREIRWSPAVRVTTMQGGAIRIYETASGFGSGLRVQGGMALNLSVARGNEWDLGINTRNADTLIIGSPNFLQYSSITSPRVTRLGDMSYNNIDSLNQVFDTQVQMGAASVYNVPRAVNRGFVFAFQTVEGNFAKVFVKASNGAILQGTAPNRYIEVEISYQPVANVPYAGVAKTDTK